MGKRRRNSAISVTPWRVPETKRRPGRSSTDSNSGAQYVSPVELAVLYAGLGDLEGAMASLERAYAARDLQLKTLLIESHLDALRPDPRFQDLLVRVGLRGER